MCRGHKVCDKVVLAGGYLAGEQAGRAMQDAILALCVQVSPVTFVCSHCTAPTVIPRLSARPLPSPRR